MQIGFIGLGRMGSNMVRRLLHHGQECVVYNRSLLLADVDGNLVTHEKILTDRARAAFTR